MKKAIAIGSALAAILLAGACSRQQPAEQPEENQSVVEPAPVAPPPAPEPEKEAPPPVAEAPAPPPPAPIAPDEQILDDADATGMTARVTRGQDDENLAANSTGPIGTP
ncbi:MAG TPA: hypothetical protein VNZ43_08595 [Sphingomonadaceae bacterium]|nr:hypothetical protein [Sphingomonadaceae bacterium]